MPVKEKQKSASKPVAKHQQKMLIVHPKGGPKVGITPQTVLRFCREYSKTMERAKEAQKALQKAAGTATTSGWTLLGSKGDSKEPVPDVATPEMKALMGQLQFVKSSLASAYGTKPVPFRLPVTTVFSTTITTGLCNTPLPVAITDSPEFASLATLFDEYRFVRGEFHYGVVTPTSTVVLATSSLGVSALATIAFDPSDNATPTDVRDLLQLEFHQQLFPQMRATPTLGTYVGLYGKNTDAAHVFKWDYKGDAAFTGNGGAVGPGQWKSTQGNVVNFPDGSLKVFYQTGESTVKACYLGTQYWDVHFRCRT